MKNERFSYVLSEYEFNIMNDLDPNGEVVEGGVLFLLHDSSFHAFNETACNMWKIISINSDYTEAILQIQKIYPKKQHKALEADIDYFFKYLIEIGAVIPKNEFRTGKFK